MCNRKLFVIVLSQLSYYGLAAMQAISKRKRCLEYLFLYSSASTLILLLMMLDR